MQSYPIDRNLDFSFHVSPLSTLHPFSLSLRSFRCETERITSKAQVWLPSGILKIKSPPSSLQGQSKKREMKETLGFTEAFELLTWVGYWLKGRAAVTIRFIVKLTSLQVKLGKR